MNITELDAFVTESFGMVAVWLRIAIGFTVWVTGIILTIGLCAEALINLVKWLTKKWRKVKMKRCPQYVGVKCVNGGCPIALREEYEERGIPVPKSCEDCYEYKGCKDCGLAGTEHCTAKEQKKHKA